MDFRERYKVILTIFLLGGAVITINLFNHQLFNPNYRAQAESRSLIKNIIDPPRGTIYDRHKKLIVVNQPSYELKIIYSELPDDFNRQYFASLLEISLEEIDQALVDIKALKFFNKNLPITLFEEIDPRIFSRFQEHLHEFPGFYPSVTSRRSYPFPYAAHTLGYVSEVTSQDLEQNSSFKIGDHKGANGIEKVYDNQLRGTKGTEYILKDNIGREVGAYQEGQLDSSAVPGVDLFTSLNIDLQALGEKLMNNKKGSIVALEPATGEVLSMVSSPSYDPNKLSFGKARSEAFIRMLTDTINEPLLDRALLAQYPPGSIFKTVIALAAMQEKIWYPSQAMTCTGEYVINEERGYKQGCRDHPRPYNIQTALQHSCNSYFYQMMRDFINHFGYATPSVGLNKFDQYLEAFGLGSPLGIDLTVEAKGFIPTPDYYDKKYNCEECWRSTYILSLGIGQGEIQMTTLQMANVAAILANRGHYFIPHIVKGIDNAGKPLDQYLEKKVVPVDPSYFEPIIDGMYRVISSGTGYRAFVRGLDICGKTGTSQNPFGDDHSVFVGFAPRDNPQIAIAVIVENAGGGGAVAAPIGSLMIEQYLRGEVAQRRQSLQQSITEIDLIDNP